MRHAVLANSDLDLHARVIHFTQHLGDAAHRLAEQRWRLGQLDHHNLARFGHRQGAARDQEVLSIALILGRDDPDAAFLQQAADDGLRRSLKDLNHAPLGPSPTVLAHDTRPDPVLMQHCAHLVGWQEDVGLAIVAQDEPMPITVPLHTAFNFICGLRKRGAGGHFFVIQS